MRGFFQLLDAEPGSSNRSASVAGSYSRSWLDQMVAIGPWRIGSRRSQSRMRLIGSHQNG